MLNSIFNARITSPTDYLLRGHLEGDDIIQFAQHTHDRKRVQVGFPRLAKHTCVVSQPFQNTLETFGYLLARKSPRNSTALSKR